MKISLESQDLVENLRSMIIMTEGEEAGTITHSYSVTLTYAVY